MLDFVVMSGDNLGQTAFVQWLLQELEDRKWTREELARQSGTASSVITNIVNGKTALGVDVAKRIARALEVPQRTVFVMAGLLDDEDTTDVKEEDQIRQIRELIAKIEDDDERERTIGILEAVVREVANRQKQSQKNRPKRSPKQNLVQGES